MKKRNLRIKVKKKSVKTKSKKFSLVLLLGLVLIILALLAYFYVYKPIVQLAPPNLILVSECGELNEPLITYRLTEDISTTGTCFTITANGVILDGNGYTITGDDGTADYGVLISDKSSVTIMNLNVVDFGFGIGSQFSSDISIVGSTITSSSVRGIGSDADENVLISNNILSQNGGSDGVGSSLALNSGKNVEVTGGSITDSVSNAIIVISDLGDAESITIENVQITNTNPSYNDLLVSTGVDGKSCESVDCVLTLVDMPYLGKYDFTDSASKLIVKESAHGEIKFLSPPRGSGTSLSDDIIIQSNSAKISTLVNPELNKPAQITLYNLGEGGFINPLIFRDDLSCSDCTSLTALDEDTVIFNVQSAAKYTIAEGIMELNDCSQLLNQVNFIYLLQNDVSTAGTCFIIDANGITLDGQSHSVTGAGGVADSGVKANGKSNIKIKNLNINNFGFGINLLSSSNSLISNNILNSNTVSIGFADVINSVIEGNTISNSELAGIILNSQDSSVKGGAITGSLGSAILLQESSSDNNIIENVLITGTDSNYYDIQWGGEGIDGTWLVDMPSIGKYSFAGAGGTLNVKNSQHGEIKFLSAVSGSGTSLSDDIIIQDNLISVDVSNSPELNKPAEITIYNPLANANKILKDGTDCPISSCTSSTPFGTIPFIFTVTDWASYSLGILIVPQVCGDGAVTGTEQCELGADNTALTADDVLSGQTCATQGFASGTLYCSASCAFDTSQCSNPSTGSPGSPGSTTPQEWLYTYRPTQQEMLTSYTKNLLVKYRIQFTFNNQTYHAGVKNITGNSVTLEVPKSPNQLTLIAGDERKFELTNDSYYDLRIKVNSVSPTNASITVQTIAEQISQGQHQTNQTQTPPSNITNQTQGPGTPTTGTLASILPIIALIILLAGVIVVIIIYLIKRPKKPRPKKISEEEVEQNKSRADLEKLSSEIKRLNRI